MRTGPQDTQRGLLATPLLGIIRAGVDVSREIAEAIDLISWKGKRRLTKGHQVKPLVRRPFQAAVVEVEAVDIDVGFHP